MAFFFVTSTAYAVSTQLDFSNGVVRFFKPMHTASLQVPSVIATSTTATSSFPILSVGKLLTEGTSAGGFTTFDSTSRLVQETYQKAEYPGHYSELQRLIWRDDLAKPVIAFQDGSGANTATPKSKAWLVAHNLSNGTQPYANFASFPATVYGPNTTPAQADYFYMDEATDTFYRWDGVTTTNNGTIAAGSWVALTALEELYGPRHQHFSVETTDDGGNNLYTRWAVQYDETIPLQSFVNSNYRFYAGTFLGQDYGNFIMDGRMYNTNDFQFYPTATNTNDHKNLVSNNTKGFRIQKSSQPITGTEETTLSALGSNFLFVNDALNVLSTGYYSGNLSVGTTNANARVTIQGTGSNDLLDVDNSSGSSVFTILASGATRLLGITEPTAPSAGNLLTYAKNIAGELFLFIKNPAGQSMPTQDAFWNQATYMWKPTTATDGLWIGTAGAGAGTFANTLPSNSTLYTQMKRARYSNVATTTNQVLGQRNTEAMWWRGDSAGEGGYFVCSNFGYNTWTNGSRHFFGLHSGTTVVSAEPSALNNTVGFAVDSGDNGAISFLTRDGSAATKAPTGLTIVSGKGYKACFYAAPNSSSIGWWIKDINTGTEASGTATNTLPTNTTFLTVGVLASNAALTAANATQLEVNQITVQSDY